MAPLEIVFDRKKLLGAKGRFGGNVFKNPARYILHIINHVNFLSFDHDDTKPSKSQVSFISLIFGLK